MKTVRFLLPVLFIFSCTSLCLAAETESSQPETQNLRRSLRFDKYYNRASEKFDFGAVNFVTGWTEVLQESINSSQKKKGFWKKTGATFTGAGKGFVNGTFDVLGGMGNMLTALFPQFRIPLPQGGVNIQQITG